MKKTWARVVCRELHLRLLVAVQHYYVLDDTCGRFAANAPQFKAVAMKMQRVNLVAGVAELQTVTLAALHRDFWLVVAESGIDKVTAGALLLFVFDIAQTMGKPLPQPPQAQGDPRANLEAIKALYAQKGIALEYKGSLNGSAGLSTKGKVYILSGLEPAREFSVLVHELAHELLHGGERRKELNRKVKETEAEAVAYAVGLSVGLDMNTASADYISLYHGDRATLRESLESITRVAAQLIAALRDGRAN